MRIRSVITSAIAAVTVGLTGIGLAPASGAAVVDSSGGICSYELTQDDVAYMEEPRAKIDEIQEPYTWNASTTFIEYKVGNGRTLKVSNAETWLWLFGSGIERREGEAELDAQIRARDIVQTYEEYSEEDALRIARLEEEEEIRDLKLTRSIYEACVAGGTGVITTPEPTVPDDETPEPTVPDDETAPQDTSGSNGSSFAGLSSL